jgi:hypothetical protein
LKGVSGAGFPFGGGTVVPYQTFTLVLGFYLFLTVLVISYVAGMQEGDDPVDLKYQICRTMPVALLIYSMAIMVGGRRIG